MYDEVDEIQDSPSLVFPEFEEYAEAMDYDSTLDKLVYYLNGFLKSFLSTAF